MNTFSKAKFQPARLIPITGIKGAQDQEKRATSALLAVIKIVPSLAKSILREVGAPVGRVETFIEPEFKMGTKKIRPDGLISITRGKTEWNALVEVKTGKNDLSLDQINSYLDICKDYGVDALITISNQVLNASGAHPTQGLDQRRLKGTRLAHFSWIRVITEAIVLSEHDQIEDTEQDHIVRELVRFLQSEASGASEFNDMGAHWTTTRDGIKNGTITRVDEAVTETVSAFQSLMRYSALTLSARLGVSAREVNIKLALTDYKKYLAQETSRLVTEKSLHGCLEIPGAASKVNIDVDIASGNVKCHFSISAPESGRNQSRVNWLVRQLDGAPSDTYVYWTYKRSRAPEAPIKLDDLRNKEFGYHLDNSREISVFRVEVLRKMGTKRTAGQGGFINSVVDAIEITYGQVLQKVKIWQAPAPKLSEKVKEIIPDSEDQANYASEV